MRTFPHEAAANSFALQPLTISAFGHSPTELLRNCQDHIRRTFEFNGFGHHYSVSDENPRSVVHHICLSSDQRHEILSVGWRKFCATAKLIGRARELLFDEVPANRQLEAGWLYLGDGTTHI